MVQDLNLDHFSSKNIHIEYILLLIIHSMALQLIPYFLHNIETLILFHGPHKYMDYTPFLSIPNCLLALRAVHITIEQR